jgi:DNA-binding transcriptional LysR family regulator
VANVIDFRNLETFVWVARLNKFHLAAEKLNTTQPAVSARIALLEQDLGTRLFDRRPRRAELTTAGLELLGYAERMLSLRAEMLQAFGGSATFTGVLRVGVPETIVHTWLTMLIERLALDYPGVTLDIEIDSTPNLHRALMAEKLDLAFLYQPGFDEDIKCEPLCAYPLAWFASADLPLPHSQIGIADLAAWPIVTFRRGSPAYAAIHQLLERHNLSHGRIFGSSAIAAIVRMAQDRIGVCVLPEVVVQRELLDKSLRRLDVDCVLPTLDFFVCYRQKSDNKLPAIAAGIAIHMARRYLEPASEPSKLSIGEI